MATYWENSCSFGLRYVSWYKYLIVSLVFSHLGFWSGNLFLIAPFPDLCLLVPFFNLLSRAVDPNTSIFNGENSNASYLRWPAWIIKFRNPQFLDFDFSLQKLSSHKKVLKSITIRTNECLYSKKHHLKVLFKEMQSVAFFIFHMGKTRMQVKNDLRCLRQKIAQLFIKI